MKPKIRQLGLVDFFPVWQSMQTFTQERQSGTADELWVVQHYPIYTQGMAGRPEHVLRENGIPIVPCDRGGQVTYHGPGQLVIYLLIDIKRLGKRVREFVNCIEQAIIDTLFEYGITARRKDNAPGVYVGTQKIASLGLRIRNGAVYHGLSLNIDMDLSPFRDINPCGYPGLEVTQLADLISQSITPEKVCPILLEHLKKQLYL